MFNRRSVRSKTTCDLKREKHQMKKRFAHYIEAHSSLSRFETLSLSSRLLRHHHLHKLFVVHFSIAINVRFSNHLVDFFVRQLLAQVRHDVSQFRRADRPVSVFIKHFKRFVQFFFAVRVLHLTRHQVEKFWEIDGTVTIRVDFVDHVLKLRFRRVLAERSHHRAC